ncbi:MULTISPECIES: hypothetical protein [Clostridia]|uniref:hypothetical protein n=1 Tax=Clostridia TaxID=186801 RepID=UPI0005D36891|nr:MULTISPECIES: hypothetical protein [Clostridia]
MTVSIHMVVIAFCALARGVHKGLFKFISMLPGTDLAMYHDKEGRRGQEVRSSFVIPAGRISERENVLEKRFKQDRSDE